MTSKLIISLLIVGILLCGFGLFSIKRDYQPLTAQQECERAWGVYAPEGTIKYCFDEFGRMKMVPYVRDGRTGYLFERVKK